MCSRQNLEGMGALGANLWLDFFSRSVTRVPYFEELYMERKTDRLKTTGITLNNYFERSLYSYTISYNNAVMQCNVDSS